MKEPFMLELDAWMQTGAQEPVPVWLYDRLVTRSPATFEELRRRNILQVLPIVEDGKVSGDVHRQLTGWRQTPLGVLAPSLLDLLGIAGEVFEHVVASLVPYCAECNELAEPPLSLDSIFFPSTGVLVLSVQDDESAVSLRERCEWLGSEWAIVRGRLERVGSLSDDRGEPAIVVLPFDRIQELRNEVSRWFIRGGQPLHLVHFISRDAVGVSLGKLSNSWRCSKCTRPYQPPVLADFDTASRCATCRGAGWIGVTNSRLTACRDCRGFGLTTGFSEYYFNNIPLHRVATVTFRELLEPDSLPAQVRARLKAIADCGFGGYPIGFPLDLLSHGERSLLSVASGEISGFRGVKYLLDGAVVDPRQLVRGEANEDTEVAKYNCIVVTRPEVCSLTFSTRQAGSGDIVLRDIQQGCLDIKELRIPIGGVTTLEGPTGSGKTLLSSIVVERFAKRRKLAHQASFGDLKRCTFIRSEAPTQQTVLEVLGLESEFAGEIARTRAAQELGMLRDDLVLPRTRYRCSECGAGADGDVMCSRCLGALYDWRVSELLVTGHTVAELLTAPLAQLEGLPWVSEAIAHRIEAVPAFIRHRVTLSTRLCSLTQTERRLLVIWGGLSRVLGGALQRQRSTENSVLSRDIVVIDGVRCLPPLHSELIGGAISAINEMGATVLYASKPEGLEFSESCVVRLQVCESSGNQRDAREQYFDTRYARICIAR